MKFAALVVAIFTSSFASVGAVDSKGYTGSEYTLMGRGYCVPSPGSGNHYGHDSNAHPLALPFTLDECAAHCLGRPDIEGLVGFDTNPGSSGRTYDHCFCRYTDGTSPDSAAEDTTNFSTSASGPVGGVDGGHSSSENNLCYRRDAFGTTPSPTTSPSKSPSMAPVTKSPSMAPVTKSPSMAPTGSPTNGPSASPSNTPPGTTGGAAPGTTGGTANGTTGGAAPGTTGGAVTTTSNSAASSSAADSLHYPDWTKSNGGCKTGGGQPEYMTLDPTTWMKATLGECCQQYFGWMLNQCNGASTGSSSGLWYPDWAGVDDTCKNDGNEPEYMALNHNSWMHSSKQSCCEANYGWILNECLGSSAGASNKWFIVWDEYTCKQDCVGNGPSCGGHANSWDELFDTRSACCASNAAWNPAGCPVD